MTTHPNILGDGWGGPLLSWLAGALTGFFGGMDGPAIVLWILALVWTITRWRNERARARILAQTEATQARAGGYAGPYRRATDAVHVIHTQPGSLST